MPAQSGKAPSGAPETLKGIVSSDNYAADEVRRRLSAAISGAGGKTIVAARSGVSLRSLDYYLVDREMKLGALVALAAACGVTVEWLATGRGPMRPGEPSPVEPTPPATPAKLFATLDIDLLAECLATAMDQLQRHSPHPSWGRAVQMAALLYDQIKEDRSGDKQGESRTVTYKR
jgi:hypothetical protein